MKVIPGQNIRPIFYSCTSQFGLFMSESVLNILKGKVHCTLQSNLRATNPYKQCRQNRLLPQQAVRVDETLFSIFLRAISRLVSGQRSSSCLSVYLRTCFIIFFSSSISFISLSHFPILQSLFPFLLFFSPSPSLSSSLSLSFYSSNPSLYFLLPHHPPSLLTLTDPRQLVFQKVEHEGRILANHILFSGAVKLAR